MQMLPRVDQVDDSDLRIYCTATAVVSARASVSLSIVDAYDVLCSGAMADPCWLACALGVILWCVLCAWVAAVVLVVGLSW